MATAGSDAWRKRADSVGDLSPVALGRSSVSTPDDATGELVVLRSQWQQAQLRWSPHGWGMVTDQWAGYIDEPVVRRDFGHEAFRRQRALRQTGTRTFEPEASDLVSRDLVRLAEEHGFTILADDPSHFAVAAPSGTTISLRTARRIGLLLESTAPEPVVLATTNHLWTAELLVTAVLAPVGGKAVASAMTDGDNKADLVIPVVPDAELILPSGSPLRALDMSRVTTTSLDAWFDGTQTVRHGEKMHD